MEILLSEQIMVTPWWAIAAAVTLPVAILVMAILGSIEKIVGTIISGVVTIIAICVLFIAPREIPTDKFSYTVEITDEAQFHELIDKGYTFEKVYPNKEIYKIKGDEIRDESDSSSHWYRKDA